MKNDDLKIKIENGTVYIQHRYGVVQLDKTENWRDVAIGKFKDGLAVSLSQSDDKLREIEGKIEKLNQEYDVIYNKRKEFFNDHYRIVDMIKATD